MPKINAQPRMAKLYSPPAEAQIKPNLPRPPELKQENVTYPHNEEDHWVYGDGSLICICVCRACWPDQGGDCPDMRGPTA